MYSNIQFRNMFGLIFELRFEKLLRNGVYCPTSLPRRCAVVLGLRQTPRAVAVALTVATACGPICAPRAVAVAVAVAAACVPKFVPRAVAVAVAAASDLKCVPRTGCDCSERLRPPTIQNVPPRRAVAVAVAITTACGKYVPPSGCGCGCGRPGPKMCPPNGCGCGCGRL